MKTMPESTIIPVLPYPDLAQAIAWLSNTLEFQERWRIGNHRAQLSYGNSTIAITVASPANAASLLVRVTDIDNHFAVRQSRGAKILSAPADYFYGERQY